MDVDPRLNQASIDFGIFTLALFILFDKAPHLVKNLSNLADISYPFIVVPGTAKSIIPGTDLLSFHSIVFIRPTGNTINVIAAHSLPIFGCRLILFCMSDSFPFDMCILGLNVLLKLYVSGSPSSANVSLSRQSAFCTLNIRLSVRQ